MKITLSMICGRESAHIEKCLRAFAPAFDSLALVFALGNQEADETEEIARRVCEELGKGIVVGYYLNGKGEPSGWAHVDDFGKARQQSALLAAGDGADWIFWADADDTVCPKTDIADLRAIAASGEADGYGFPYDVVGTGKRPTRERLYRASLFTSGEVSWQGTVHENIVGAKIAAKESPVWRHSPSASKGDSQGRNLRLLQHQMRNAAIHAFYVHQEYALRGDWAKAKPWRDSALALPGLPNAFRYELALNSVRLGPREEAEAWAAKAFAWFPACREAMAFLALLRMEEGRFADALTLAERLTQIPPPAPEVRPWCFEAKWYSWGEYDLLARLLRLNGRDGEPAEMMMRRGAKAKISLIHATRGRHNAALAARERWLNAAADPASVETIWCVDADDKESVIVARQFRHVVVEPGGGCVRAWNAGAEKAEGKVLVQLSDDWLPPQGWDRSILAELGDLDKPAVLAVSDGHRKDDLLCMAILTRARWEAQGRQMFHPEFVSMYSDNWFSLCAWRDGVVVDARERLTFEHMHPAFGKAQVDATYSASNSNERYEHGQRIFEWLKSGGDKEQVSPSGVFQSELHGGQFNSPKLAAWLVQNLKRDVPVNDLGCGNGFIVEKLTEAGFAATGYEGDPCKAEHIKADLTQPISFARAGQTVCVEVGEHIPASLTPAFVSNLQASTLPRELCVMSWAVVGQGGRGHVNCKDNADVIEMMAQAGFSFESQLTAEARAQANDLFWLKNTLLVFRRSG